MDKAIFFNASMCKAGSEMLQALFAQNYEIHATRTSAVPDYLEALRERRGRSQPVGALPVGQRRASFNNACYGMMQGYYLTFTEKDVVIDKSRAWLAHIEWLRAILGCEPRIVCMIRDLRDVVASFERTYRESGDIAFGSTKSIITGKERPFPDMKQDRIKFYLEEFTPLAPFLRQLHEANDRFHVLPPEGVIRKGGEHSDIPLPAVKLIRYEDFTHAPGKWMADIYNWFGLPPHEHDFNDIDPNRMWSESGEIPGAFGPFGDHRVPPGGVRKSVPDSFKDVLNEEDERFIATHSRWFFELGGYL